MLFNTLLSANMSKTIGLVTNDSTLVFQLINTVLLLFIVIGIPILIYKLIKSSHRNKMEIEKLRHQVSTLIERDQKHS